ncbi:elongation of very long chain fatty acids protein 7 [Nephila pilipes]|uniref:Elongation of very long chain fatty acids protein n=1 Tax=Nephila pilipes TaxID=299642 RepID=A0A8X6NY96_NEPPI|nr:elongation of very long chain fatty acids protein 7 [Nephila pilipes]
MLLNAVYNFFTDYDVKKKVLIENPYLPISIIIIYILFVTRIGPFVMKFREPFKLKEILLIYNFLQVVVNTYICFEIFTLLYKKSNKLCNVRYNPELPEILKEFMRVAWCLYITKFVDLFDTVFFVLRKKQTHVTFLHVFHHSGICLLVLWFMSHIQYLAGAYCAFAMGLNAGIHVIMYTYYGISSFGPSMQKYLWWKQYLTILQIGQLCIIFLYMFIGVLIGCEDLGIFETIAFVYLAHGPNNKCYVNQYDMRTIMTKDIKVTTGRRRDNINKFSEELQYMERA